MEDEYARREVMGLDIPELGRDVEYGIIFIGTILRAGLRGRGGEGVGGGDYERRGVREVEWDSDRLLWLTMDFETGNARTLYI